MLFDANVDDDEESCLQFEVCKLCNNVHARRDVNPKIMSCQTRTTSFPFDRLLGEKPISFTMHLTV